MNICIVGSGYVGLTTGACFAELGNKVICVDNNKQKIDLLEKGQIPFYEPGLLSLVKKNSKKKRLFFSTQIDTAVKKSEIVFIAVGTPPKTNGEADLSFVENVAKEIARSIKKYTVVVEKSTVPVETGEMVVRTIESIGVKRELFDVVSNPEFLREGSAIKDFLYPDRIVVGTDSQKARKVMKKLYTKIKAPLIFTDIRSAEIIKHAANSFLATKISFINALSRVCELSSANVDEVALGIGLDKRIGKSFLNAGIGYGGSCFPKDVSAFIKITGKKGYDFKLLKEVENINNNQIDFFNEKIKSALLNIKGKSIAVLGLSFKPNTDDMREAPSIKIIDYLLSEGANIKAFDPKAMENAKKLFPQIEYTKTSLDATKGADAAVFLTEWDEFKKIDLNKLKKSLKSQIILDGRNIFHAQKMRELGFNYHSVGRPTKKVML